MSHNMSVAGVRVVEFGTNRSSKMFHYRENHPITHTTTLYYSFSVPPGVGG